MLPDQPACKQARANVSRHDKVHVVVSNVSNHMVLPLALGKPYVTRSLTQTVSDDSRHVMSSTVASQASWTHATYITYQAFQESKTRVLVMHGHQMPQHQTSPV